MTPPPIIVNPVVPGPGVHPAYVEHGGELSNRHPATGRDARMYGFVIEADADRLDEWCDLCLNEPSGGAESWQALGGCVLLDFIHIPKLQSSDPLDEPLGFTKENEVALWVPLIDRRRGRVGWTIPYIWVDSGYAMAGGRETYGFPKQYGTPTIPLGADAPSVLSLDAATLKTFDVGSTAADQRVVTVQRPGTAVPLQPSSWTNADDALWELLGPSGSFSTVADFFLDPMGALDLMADEFAAAVSFFAGLVSGSLPVVLLKQFRDAARPGLACYQGIVEVATRLDQFHRGGGLPNDYQVKFEELDGEPVRRELGVPTETWITPAAAFWLEFDFTVLLGRALWEA